MSWNIWVDATARTTVYERNATFNYVPIFREALGCEFRDLDGQKGAEVLKRLRRAVQDITEHPERYEALEPENGWGTVEDALAVLREMLQTCEAYADSEIHVC